MPGKAKTAGISATQKTGEFVAVKKRNNLSSGHISASQFLTVGRNQHGASQGHQVAIIVEGDLNKNAVKYRGGRNLRSEDLDLSNVQFNIVEDLNPEADNIHKYAVLTRFITNGYKKNDFVAENEKEIISNFQRLSEPERQAFYQSLKNEVNNILG